MHICVQFVLFLVLCSCVSECARILAVAPLPSYSHQVAYRPIWKELSLRGHNVTLITTDPIKDSSLKNLTEIDIHDVAYHAWRSSGIVQLLKQHQKNPVAIRDKYIEVFVTMFDSTMNQAEIKDFLQSNETFDLVITEPLIPIGLGFAERYKSKLILVTSLEAPTYIHVALGNPFHPVLYPERALAITPDSYLKRVAITILSAYYFYFQSNFNDLSTSLLRKHFGADLLHMDEIVDKTNMLFANVNPLFTGVRPLTPSTVYFGRGSHLEPEKPLPADLKDYLDNAKEGVVYFSLGTNVLSVDLPQEKKAMFLETFQEMPYKFLWKYEDNSLKPLPDNVKIAEWVPQQDVLRHPNVKAFFTQGGLQSTEEAIFSKVPIIGMPQMGDQAYNVERVVALGMGVAVDFDALNKDDLKRSISEVITNSSYRDNMEQFVKLSTDWPLSGVEETVWWTEYVLRHNSTEHLKGPARKMPTHQYLLLDVVALVVVVVVATSYLSIKLLKVLFECFAAKIKGKTHRD